MADKQTTEAKEALVSVKVIAENHTHKGKPVKPGDSIEVSKNQIEWLVKNKIIEG